MSSSIRYGWLCSNWRNWTYVEAVVNPSGPNSDLLYHGLIWILSVIGGPAATGVPPDPKRIRAYIRPRVTTVPSGIDSRQLYLRLDHEDDGYGDNGYYSHDDGTQDQCKGVGNAYVVLTITHGGNPPPPSAAAPFDLVWDAEDDNGIPLNPKWGWQVTHGVCPGPERQRMIRMGCEHSRELFSEQGKTQARRPDPRPTRIRPNDGSHGLVSRVQTCGPYG
jgi:hypothetical protein